jgi:hypothetical protein
MRRSLTTAAEKRDSLELYYKAPDGQVTMTDKTAGLTVYWFGRLPQNVARLSDMPAGFR